MKIKAYPSVSQSWGIIGLTFLTMLFLAPLNYYLNDAVGDSKSFLIYYVLTMLIPFTIFHKLKEKEEGLVYYQFIPKNFLVALILIVATLAMQWGLTAPLSNLIPMPDSIREIFKDMALKMNDGYGLIAVAVMAPLFEELIFRGIILDGLLKRKSILKAILISSLLFGIVHFNPWQFIPAFVIGTFSGWIYYRTKNLSYSILIHITNNFAAALLMYFDEVGEMMDMNVVEMYGGIQSMILTITACLIVLMGGIFVLNKILPQNPIWHIESEKNEDNASHKSRK